MVKTKHKSKNIGFCTLDGPKCINPIVKLLFKHVPMSIRSSQIPNQFFKVLTSLAIQKLSIHSIQRPGSSIPSENSLHHNLKKIDIGQLETVNPVSYTHLRAHETPEHLVCRLLLEKKKKKNKQKKQKKTKKKKTKKKKKKQKKK